MSRYLSADIVINAAGMWARQLGQLAGVEIPAIAVEHQYMVTDKTLQVGADWPTLRDPDHTFYLKPEVGGLALGGWEQGSRPFAVDSVPEGFSQQLLAENFDRFEQVLLPAVKRIPALNDIGIRQLINGPIPVTPDGEPILGPVAELDNFWLACGFTAGIAGAGGAGKVLAEWIVHGDPGIDMTEFDLRRFPAGLTDSQLAAQCVDIYGNYYTLEEAYRG